MTTFISQNSTIYLRVNLSSDGTYGLISGYGGQPFLLHHTSEDHDKDVDVKYNSWIISVINYENKITIPSNGRFVFFILLMKMFDFFLY